MQLKKEVEKKVEQSKPGNDLVELLLSAPTYSEKQLEEVAETRKKINQWRQK